MILPPFDPPDFDALTRFWRSCTYGDVHTLILEVLHYRLTVMELAGMARGVDIQFGKLVAEDSPEAKPARQLRRFVEREQLRGGPVGQSREQISPFSDEWRAREAVRCKLFEHPAPAGDESRKLPTFSRVTWLEMREAWRETEHEKGQQFTLEQRMLLEVALTRRVFRHLENLARRAQSDLEVQNATSPALDELLCAIRLEIDECRW